MFAAGDTLIIEAGTYDLGSGALSSFSTVDAPQGATVEGNPGNTPPTISTDSGNVVQGSGAGVTVRWLILNDSASSAYAVESSNDDTTVDDVQISGASAGVHLTGNGERVLDSSIHMQSDGMILDGSTSPAADNVRNVTVTSDQETAIRAETSSGPHAALEVSIKNSLARGGTFGVDLSQFAFSAPVSMDVSYSNFTSTDGVVTNLGHNQSSTPAFVDAPAGDYRELPGSPTIDAGTADPANGTSDPNGNPRTLGLAPDIGAFEFVEKPAAGTEGVSTNAGGRATLNGVVNPNGEPTTAEFDLGTSPGVYAHHLTTTNTPGHSNALTPVSVTATGLAPNTTYYYRLAATNIAGTAVGQQASFRTPPPSIPSLTHVRESNHRWREGNHLASISRHRPPVGTVFAFTLNESAKLSLAFSQKVAGHRSHHRCRIGATRHHNLRCTALVSRGTVRLHGHSGTNHISFQGKVSKHKRLPVGSYQLVLTATDAVGHRTHHTINFTIVH